MSKPEIDTTIYWRQMDVLPMKKVLSVPVTVVGAGAIGKAMVEVLSGMGINDITVFDADSVEPHNLPNQGYRPCDVGKPKVEALAEIVEALTGFKIKGMNEWFTDQKVSEITVCAVDSMDTRMKLWEAIAPQLPKLYIDMRMGAEIGQIFYVNPWSPGSKRQYEANLFPSDEAVEAPCTERATKYCATGITSFAAGGVANYLRGEALRPLVLDFRCGQVIDLPKATEKP